MRYTTLPLTARFIAALIAFDNSIMNRFIFLVLVVFGLISCDKGNIEVKKDIEVILSVNESWPYPVEGKVEVADAHQAEDDILDWASAIFTPTQLAGKIVVFVERDIIVKSGLDFESEKIFVLSLGKPTIEDGRYKTYPVLKMKLSESSN